MLGLNGIPQLYDYKNGYNAEFSPSQIHARNTGLSLYYQRYLMQKVFSVYDFNIPEGWDRSYFLYVLFCLGFGIVLDTEDFGTIFQHGQLYGRNVYYRPTKAVVANPLLPNVKTLTINEDCAVIKLTPDYRGIFDIVALYADMMALITETFGVNTINSKFAFVMAADNKTMAESLKKMYDDVAGGIPAVVVDKHLYDDATGKPRWEMFVQNLKTNFLGLDLMQCLRAIEDEFDQTVGIENANTDKRERLLVSEVESNIQNTNALVDVYVESLTDSFKTVNEMFGLDLYVKKRYDEIVKDGNKFTNERGVE